MDKVYIYIIGLFLFTFSCGSNKIVTDSNITSSDYPYISAFHQAIRLKIAGRNLESIKKLEYCLSLRKDDAAVYYLLSQLEFSYGNIDKSADYIIKASEIDSPETLVTVLQKARLERNLLMQICITNHVYIPATCGSSVHTTTCLRQEKRKSDLLLRLRT